MSNYFQIIVDRDASVEEAKQLAEEIRIALPQYQIIKDVLTDCVLGGTGLGYAPGSN